MTIYDYIVIKFQSLTNFQYGVMNIRILMRPTIIIFYYYITSSSDLQPSTALANQLPGQLVSTQISTTRPNCFKFIIALIMTSINIV